MNIFYLDRDVKLCAKYHCDKHVVKMILEYAQLLSVACRYYGLDCGYKETHSNHPCAIWVRYSEENFLYLVDLQHYLNEEYKLRFNHTTDHKSFSLVESLVLPAKFNNSGFTEPPKCVPEDLKQLDLVDAYREYYRRDKAYFCTWKTKQPEWFN